MNRLRNCYTLRRQPRNDLHFAPVVSELRAAIQAHHVGARFAASSRALPGSLVAHGKAIVVVVTTEEKLPQGREHRLSSRNHRPHYAATSYLDSTARQKVRSACKPL